MSLSRSEIEETLAGLSAADLQRINNKACIYARGLVHLSPKDLIQEVWIKFLTGERVFPRDARPVIVIINAMHSEASNCREREQSGAIDHHVDISAMSQEIEDDEGTVVVVPRHDVTPERILVARWDLSVIESLVADSSELQELVVAWALGLRGEAAAADLGWGMNQYEAARKRLVRRLESIKE